MLLSDDVHRVEFKEEEEHVSFIFVFKEKTSVMFSKQEAEEKRKKKKRYCMEQKSRISHTAGIQRSS